MSNRMKLKLVAPPDRDRRQDLVRRKRHDRYRRILKGVIALPVLAVGVILVQTVFLAKKPFYVYSDKGAPGNHYIPSGFMGDYRDLVLDISNYENPKAGKTCMKITYSAKGSDGLNWAGIYWQTPPNNWGDREGSPEATNLTGRRRLTFWARGAKGGEVINEFKIGGISGAYPDSTESSIGPVTLTDQWQQYTIDLRKQDLHHIIGGFCFAASRDNNPQGMTFYIDEVRYE